MSNIIPYDSSLDIGKGYNSVKGKTLGSIFLPDIELSGPTGATGQDVKFRLVRLEEREQLYEELGISVDAGFRYCLFNARNKFAFAEQSSYSAYSLFFLLSVRVTNAVKHIKRYALNPDVVKLLKEGELDMFRRGYGDSYIESITTGGEFFALFEFTCTDATSKTAISNELDAEVKGFGVGGDINVKFMKSVERAMSKTEVKATVYQTGGVGEKVPSSPLEMLERATNFPSIVMGDKGVIYEALFQSYETLPLPKGPNYVALENKKYVLDTYAKDIVKWRSALTDLDYIIEKPMEFEISPEASMDQVRAQRIATGNIINAYTEHAIRCADSIDDCATFVPPKEDLEKIDKTKLPARKKTADFVVIYEGKNFSGNADYLVRGEYKDGEKDLPSSNNKISSIKIPQNWQVTLFEEPYFNGRKLPLTESCPDLEVHQFDDVASSIFVGLAGETVTRQEPPQVLTPPKKISSILTKTLPKANPKRIILRKKDL